MENYLMLNGKKIILTAEQVDTLLGSAEGEQVKLADIPEGKTFKIGEYEFIVLERSSGTTAVLLKNFRDNKYVNHAFYGLRPASTGLIGAACVAVILEVLTSVTVLSEGRIFNGFGLGEGALLHWPKLALAAVLLVLTNWVKPVKNWHPIVFIGLSAVVGIVLGFSAV